MSQPAISRVTVEAVNIYETVAKRYPKNPGHNFNVFAMVYCISVVWGDFPTRRQAGGQRGFFSARQLPPPCPSFRPTPTSFGCANRFSVHFSSNS